MFSWLKPARVIANCQAPDSGLQRCCSLKALPQPSGHRLYQPRFELHQLQVGSSTPGLNFSISSKWALVPQVWTLSTPSSFSTLGLNFSIISFWGCGFLSFSWKQSQLKDSVIKIQDYLKTLRLHFLDGDTFFSTLQSTYCWPVTLIYLGN